MSVAGWRKAVVLLSFIVLPSAAAQAAEVDWLRGQYEAFSSGKQCVLKVDQSGAYDLRCRGGLSSRGTLHRVGAGFLFDAGGQSAAALYQYMKEFSVAARLHAEQQLKDHGYLPIVIPSKLPDQPGRPAGVFVPAVFGRKLYLVNLFEREAFCAAAIAGQAPSATGGEHYVFRSRRQGTWSEALSTKAFCDRGWSMSFH